MLEVDHVMQALGEFVKQLPQVAVRGDGFRNFQQGPVLPGECFTGLLRFPTHKA
jgi:hypothetical protein